jgi:hypothetical protein
MFFPSFVRCALFVIMHCNAKQYVCVYICLQKLPVCPIHLYAGNSRYFQLIVSQVRFHIPFCLFDVAFESCTLLRHHSVHKSQGQTFNKMGLYFNQDPFAHGQLYVALSRVAGWHKITVLGLNSFRNIVKSFLVTG